MSLADDLKPLLREIRAIPGQLGLRPHRVYIRIRPNIGSSFGDTVLTDETELTEGDSQPPKVRQLNDEQLQLGNLPAGSLEIGPMTPSDELDALLRGDDMANLDSLTVRVEGPSGNAIYTIQKRPMDYSLRRVITVSPLSTPDTTT